ncbi:glycosyl hydrolase [Xylariaceae sp. FL0016]|nr:glycosyl hydrolase [Xylariaceae sp. FL0016]
MIAADAESTKSPAKPPHWRRHLFRIYLPVLGALVTIVTVVALAVSLTGQAHSKPTKHTSSPTPIAQPVQTNKQGVYPGPETINGVIPNNDHPQTLDPSLVRRADGKLFLYTTAKNGSVWTADSLYGPWTHQGIAKLPENGGAPSIQKVDDTYYMFYNNHEFKYSSIGVKNSAAATWNHGSSLLVASSKTLEVGSWQQHGRLPIDWSENYNQLDATLLQVQGANNKRQLLFSFGSYQQGIYQIPMADPPIKLADNAMQSITHLANNQTSGWPSGPTEGAFTFQHGEFYYLFFSSGRCCVQPKTKTWLDVGDVYKVMVCRSKNPRSGYVDKAGRSCADASGGTQILASHGNIWAPGGQGVMNDDEAGGPMIYYHYVPYDQKTKTPAKKYQFGWNKLNFDSGWPVVVQ